MVFMLTRYFYGISSRRSLIHSEQQGINEVILLTVCCRQFDDDHIFLLREDIHGIQCTEDFWTWCDILERRSGVCAKPAHSPSR